ncbi:hypothetical protein EJB05_56716, partial [Eragrostis curvula]
MLNNPRQMIAQVEVLVSVVAALLFLQFIFDSSKRLWQNSILSCGLKVCNIVMFPIIAYTLSVMQSSPIKNSVYPVWAVSLIMASGGAGAIRQSDLPASKITIMMFIEIARYAFYLIMFSRLLAPNSVKDNGSLEHQGHNRHRNASSVCTSWFLVLALITKGLEALLVLRIGFDWSETVAKWMKRNADDSDPTSMNDYKYIVSGPLDRLIRGTSFDSITTLDQIWHCLGDFDDEETLEDLCLSCALFELLKRRYYGLVCAEARLRITQDFVFKVLLPHPDADYKRAFKIVETELGFCYDFFFTKYHMIYATGREQLPYWTIWSVTSLGMVILIFMVGVYALNNSLVLETPSPIIEVRSAKADYIIALVFLGIILMVILLQSTFYLASDWFKVSLVCRHVKQKSCAPIAFVTEKVLGFISRVTISARLRNTIGQFSFISDRGRFNCWTILKYILGTGDHVKVSDAVKKAFAISLISTGGKLTNGEASLRKHNMFDEYFWTLKDHSQIEAMLIWHIATDYCALALSDDGEDRNVAVNFSRYYAYLIVCVKELLQYDVADMRELESTVTEEVEYLARFRSSEMYEVMKHLPETEEEDNPATIFAKGVKLGKQLEKWSNDNRAKPWKMLAEFWAETIIYITPSHHTAKHHMQHLESGGEFLTQIWVLLSHAGILNLDREKDQGPKPAQPETA